MSKCEAGDAWGSIPAEYRNAILERVDADRRFRFVKFRGGVACYYEVWEYVGYQEPVTVVFKFSDNSWLVRADGIGDLVPDLVLHADGALCGSWDRGVKVMLQPADGVGDVRSEEE